MTTSSPSEADEVRANVGITKFLDYYVDPNRPFDYAVMVNGAWGSGKTHLVKEFLKSRSSLKPLFVTLYGISSADQIDQEFYRQLHPILSSRGMRIADAAARAVLKGTLRLDLSKDEAATLNVAIPDGDLTKDLTNPGDRLLIFDDLERCKMPVSEVLGYINGFVEHDGLKAIIIANETEIRTNLEPRYDEIREKLIGQTLTVSAPAGEAFDAILGEVKHNATKGFLKSHREAVLALHAQGGRGNLRTLKYAMWNFEKIGSQLEQRHWSKEESVLKIMKGVMAVTMEYRAGQLNEDDLNSLIGNRIGRLMRIQLRNEKSKVDLIDDRYPQVDFDDVLLDGPMLAAILLRGEMDGALVDALDATNDYAIPAEQPLWFQAVHATTFDDATCERIASELEGAFTKRLFAGRSEFLLIAGIRLWFTKIGLLSKTRAEIVTESKGYIDDLALNDRLETSLDQPSEVRRDNIYRGHSIPESGSAEHQQIVAHYDEMAQRQEEKRYPQIARDLLDELHSDPDAFLFDLAPNNVTNGRYWDRPILAALPPGDYARIVFEASPEIQSRAIEAIHSRHDGHGQPLLQSERPWIAMVKEELEKLMATAGPMTRYRLHSLISRNLDPLIPDPATERDGSAADRSN